MALNRLKGIIVPSKALDTPMASEDAGASITIVGQDPTCPRQDTIGAADASTTRGNEAMVEQIDVEFGVDGNVTLRGWLFVPDVPGPRPAITMAHGYAGIREHGLSRFARLFADAGCVVLVHDHRGFGVSDGLPPMPATGPMSNCQLPWPPS